MRGNAKAHDPADRVDPGAIDRRAFSLLTNAWAKMALTAWSKSIMDVDESIMDLYMSILDSSGDIYEICILEQQRWHGKN